MPKLKTLAVPASIFLLLMAAVQPASAANWVEIDKVGDEEIWSMDRDSVQTKGNIVSAWVKIEYPSTIGRSLPSGATSFLGSPYHYSQDLLEFDFSDRTFRVVAHYEYDANGNRTGGNTTPLRWERIAPDTNAEYVYSILKKWLNR